MDVGVWTICIDAVVMNTCVVIQVSFPLFSVPCLDHKSLLLASCKNTIAYLSSQIALELNKSQAESSIVKELEYYFTLNNFYQFLAIYTAALELHYENYFRA